MDQKSDRHVHEDPKRRTSSNTQHRNNPLKTLPGSLFSSSSGIEDIHCIKRERRKSKSTSLAGERKRKRYSRSRSRSDSETSSSSASSDELRHRKKKKKTKKTKDRKKEKKKSHKHKKKKHKKNREEKSHTTEALGKSNPKLNLETAESSQKTVKVKPTEAKRFAPMTQEQWEKEQSKIRKEFDEETGRVRLVRGSGEIIESIVSKQQHREINRAATQQDGNYFQMQLNRKLK